MWTTFGGRGVETRNAATERLVELEVVLLRAIHVHNVDRVAVRLTVFVSFALPVDLCFDRSRLVRALLN